MQPEQHPRPHLFHAARMFPSERGALLEWARVVLGLDELRMQDSLEVQGAVAADALRLREEARPPPEKGEERLSLMLAETVQAAVGRASVVEVASAVAVVLEV